ncbi:MAG: acetylglutamate kinase [Candidatus Omnitrophota bacterium]|nr:MAG: acetylglutamate kinase [Candidatus Omnitrophota bacterium]
MVEEAIKKAGILIEALPYIKKFHEKIFVIKYGGSILGEKRIRKSVLEDIAFLRYTGIRPILVHGGGPDITERLKKCKVTTRFVEGMRVTDEFTLKIVEEELNKLNDLIVQEINSQKAPAKGLRRESGILTAVKKQSKKDLGFVGEMINCNVRQLKETAKKAIPVIAPMGASGDGTTFNINADEVASFLASQLKAEKLILLTNVLGVMRKSGDESSLISTLTIKEAEELIGEKVVDEGMIPKVRAAVGAIQTGVSKAHIIDAKVPHAILLEIFTNEGVGTEITQ